MAGSLGQSIFRVVFTAVLARLLSPEDFGIIATATIVTGFSVMIVQFGVGQALIQKIDINKIVLLTAFSSSTIVGLLFMMIVMLSSKSLAIFFEQPELEKILFFLSLLFPIKGFNQVQFALLQRNMRFKSLAGRDVLSYVFGYGIFGISLAVLGYGVKSLMIAILMQSIMYTFLLWVTLKSNSIFFRFSYSSFKHL